MRGRVSRGFNVVLLARWSPLARMPDLLTVAAILCAYTAWAFHDPGKYISRASIFGELPSDLQSLAASACIVACLLAYLSPYVGGWMAMILGLGLRFYDAFTQGSPIAMIIYGVIFGLGVIRLIQRRREADLTRFVMEEARTLVRERAFVEALLNRDEGR